MTQFDYVEQWMRVSARDQSKNIEYLRALLCETLWFPVGSRGFDDARGSLAATRDP
jgi:hypothetical protein